MGLLGKIQEWLTVATPLSPAERAELSSCVETVKRGLRSFLEAGQALENIRAKQLYREGHRTFESFAEREFGLSDRRLHQLIESFKLVENLKSISPSLPTPKVEAAVRPLAGLNPVDQLAAYTEAVEAAGGGAPAPKLVKAAADKRRAAKPGNRAAKPVRLRVPGATVEVFPNKAFTTVEAALEAALAQVRSAAGERKVA